jgi:hypothetical protein
MSIDSTPVPAPASDGAGAGAEEQQSESDKEDEITDLYTPNTDASGREPETANDENDPQHGPGGSDAQAVPSSGTSVGEVISMCTLLTTVQPTSRPHIPVPPQCHRVMSQCIRIYIVLYSGLDSHLI